METDHEALVKELNDPALRAEYARAYDHYQVGFVPRILGWFLILLGTITYGRAPRYEKFKAIEIIARIPYQSWEVATYTLLTLFYKDEAKAIHLTHTSAFSRFAQDNETMHVVVISQLVRKHCRQGFIRHIFIPLLFAFFYFWTIYILYLFSKKAVLELNYVFENHAYHQYEEFLARKGDHLRKNPILSDFLTFYGRHPRSEYEFFESVRNDELIHRNRTIRELEAHY